jgi:FAD/FMN-containing dehydrogenase
MDDYVIYGNGRSYGDVCLNSTSGLIDTCNLDRFVDYDEEKLTITCQAGMLLVDLLKYLVPRNRFVQVTPGTAYVTIGGMIANDVHGKNHHLVGSFGNHVESIKLLRSDRGIVNCSPTENKELFYATIGGLGLTGLILTATLKLKAVQTPCVEVMSQPTQGIDQLIELFNQGSTDNEYTVAWLDLQSKLLNGIFSFGRHSAEKQGCGKLTSPKKVKLHGPNWLLNRYSNTLFNRLYYIKNKFNTTSRQTYRDFFYPLDKLEDWNRLYGKRGFYQYQLVVPVSDFYEVFLAILSIMQRHQQLSYLTVLKKFGDIESVGMMSFPRSGYTLAMDFPNLGKQTLKMLSEFDNIVSSAKGAVYPAKDARMSSDMFKESFPQLDKFVAYRDEKFISDFWRRVMVDYV